MQEFESREREPQPRWESIDLVALRRLNNACAAELRATLPLVLAGILGEVPHSQLALTMITDPDGVVNVSVSAAAGADTPTMLAEIAAAVEPIAQIAAGANPGIDAALRWPVIPSRRRALGFRPATEPGTGAVRWPAGEGETRQWLEDLAALPGQGLHVMLRPATHGGEARWEAKPQVVTGGDGPSLRLRAAVRRRWPGLEVAASPADAAVWLQVGEGELARLFALPVCGPESLRGAYTAAPAPIAVSPTRTAAPESHTELHVGQAMTNSGRSVPVRLAMAERLRHVHVLGRTGTGKSSALAAMVHDLAGGPDGALIADPHGQLCDRLLAELPDSARDRTWVIRCGDVHNPVPINPLAETDPVRRDIAIADLCATFQYLYDKNATGIVGPRFSERVAMTLRALAAAHGPRASLLDVPIAAASQSFMDAAVKKSGDRRLQTWWRTDKLERQSSEHGQVVAWVNSKFDAFASTAAMRGILGSGADAIDFAAAMDDGRIILLDLSKAELGEAASRLLGFMYLSRVWTAALRRTRAQRPFTVVVDEAHTLIAGALTNMLTEGRKFGLSVVLAHQYLDQLDAELRPAVDGNVATTIAFRCAVGDAGEMHKRFGGLVDPSVLVTLPDLTAVSLRTAQAGPAHPFTLIVDHNQRVTQRSGAELATHVDAVMTSTRTDLVEPHRAITAYALGGISNVTMLAAPDIPSPITGRDPAAEIATPTSRPADRAAATGPAKPASFLDGWIAARTASSTDREQDPAEVPSPGESA